MMKSVRQVQGGVVKLACMVCLLSAAQALGASYVNFVLELGGDNRRELWKSANQPPAGAMFVPGSTAQGQLMPLGGNITWAVRVEAGGVQDAGNGAGSPIWGAANLVLNLELYKDSIAPENLATGVIWNSTINDGTAYDLTASAAFAASYNVANLGPGRVIDQKILSGKPQGGPFMGAPGWPLVGNPPKAPKNARTYPTAEPGKLIGIGAGYFQWSPSGSQGTVAGVGMETLPNGSAGLGVVPVFEGQMDTTNLTEGTYILRAVPGAGINVLRGDVNLASPQNAFATAAEQMNGSTITFTLTPIPLPGVPSDPSPADLAGDVATNPTLTWTSSDATSYDVYFGDTNPPPFIGNQAMASYSPSPLLLNATYYWKVLAKNAAGTTPGPVWSFTTGPLFASGWKSLRDHGGTLYALALDPASTRSDPRQGGPQKIVVEFSAQADFLDPPAVSGSDGSHPFAAAMMINDNMAMELTFSPGTLLEGVCYTIDLTEKVYDLQTFNYIGGDTDCTFRVLHGDVTGNGVVNLGDAIYAKKNAGQALSDATAKFDVNASGSITLGDVTAAKALMGAASGCQ